MNTNNQEKPRHSGPFVVLALLLCLTVPLMAVPAGAELFEDNVYIELDDFQIDLPSGIERFPNVVIFIDPSEYTFYLVASFGKIDIELIKNTGMLIVNYGGFIVEKVAYKAVWPDPDQPIPWVAGSYFPITSSGFVSVEPDQIGIVLNGSVDYQVFSMVGDPNPTTVLLPELNIEVDKDGDLENGLNITLSSMGKLLTALFTPSGSLFPLSVSVGLGIGVAVISWCVKKKRMVW